MYRQSARRRLQVIHPVVGCHYFHNHTHIYIAPLRGGFRGAGSLHQACIDLPSHSASLPLGWYQVILLGERHTGVNNLPKVVMQLLLRVGFEPTTC